MNRHWMWTTVAIVAPAPVVADELFLSAEDAPRALFPDGTSSAKKSLILNAGQLEELSQALQRRVSQGTYPYYEVRDGTRLVGVAFLLDVIGQAEPISFAVGVGPDGRIRDVQVMVYRETHGDEIRSKRFMRQFSGKDTRAPLIIGKDVDAITGATISSRSAAYAVKKALKLSSFVLPELSGDAKK